MHTTYSWHTQAVNTVWPGSITWIVYTQGTVAEKWLVMLQRFSNQCQCLGASPRQLVEIQTVAYMHWWCRGSGVIFTMCLGSAWRFTQHHDTGPMKGHVKYTYIIAFPRNTIAFPRHNIAFSRNIIPFSRNTYCLLSQCYCVLSKYYCVNSNEIVILFRSLEISISFPRNSISVPRNTIAFPRNKPLFLYLQISISFHRKKDFLPSKYFCVLSQ